MSKELKAALITSAILLTVFLWIILLMQFGALAIKIPVVLLAALTIPYVIYNIVLSELKRYA